MLLREEQQREEQRQLKGVEIAFVALIERRYGVTIAEHENASLAPQLEQQM